MAFVRLVHPIHYNRETGRFNSYVYKKLHGGMSVVDRDCAESRSGSIAKHAARFYSGIVGDPIIFYVIEDAELPANATVSQSTSDSGDDCHHDIAGVNDNTLKRKRWFQATAALGLA